MGRFRGPDANPHEGILSAYPGLTLLGIFAAAGEAPTAPETLYAERLEVARR